MSVKVPFKFEEFYEAFGKSVSSDVVFEDGRILIVQREKPPSLDATSSEKQAPAPEPSSPAVTSDGPIQKHAKGRLLDSADRRRLPWAIRALLEIQEPDGSWNFSSAFEFVVNGVAPAPVAGVSGKLWATAVAITVWRQFPEYFELLESNYEKAMLHADENVLRIVRSVLQFDCLDQVSTSALTQRRAPLSVRLMSCRFELLKTTRPERFGSNWSVKLRLSGSLSLPRKKRLLGCVSRKFVRRSSA